MDIKLAPLAYIALCVCNILMDVLEIERPKIKKARGSNLKPRPIIAAPKNHDEPTQAEYEYARDLNDRYNLNLTYAFLRHRKGIRQLIKCFGYHKDSADAEGTGNYRIYLLRKSYYFSSNPAWLTEKLNSRTSDNILLVDDVEFMIDYEWKR